MSEVASIIDRLGGYARVASGIGMPSGTVAAWRHRRSIPVRYWPLLTKLADASEIDGATYTHLVTAHAADRALTKDATPRAVSA